MASRQIRRLRSIHLDLQSLYNNYTGTASTHRKAITALGPVHGAQSVTQLQRQHSNATSQLAALREEADRAIAAILANATKSKVEVTEATKGDIRDAFADGMSIHQICQWIQSSGRPDGYVALHDILERKSFKQDNPQQWLAEQAQTVLSYERQSMPPEQIEKLDEVREVEACKAWLYRDFDNLDKFMVDQASPNGGLRQQLTSLSKWVGIPGPHEGNSGELLSDGIDVKLTNVA